MRIVLLVNVAKIIFQLISKSISAYESVRDILKQTSFQHFMEVLHQVVEQI